MNTRDLAQPSHSPRTTVTWQGRPLVTVTLDVDLRCADAWGPGVRRALDVDGLRYFVLSYLPGRWEWGLGLSPRLMMCLYNWLSRLGTPFTLADDLRGKSRLIPAPLERWGPVGPREWTYWLPGHRDGLDAVWDPSLERFVDLGHPPSSDVWGLWLALPAALGTSSAPDLDQVYRAVGLLSGRPKAANEDPEQPRSLWTEGRVIILLGVPNRLLCRVGQQTGLLLGAYTEAAGWETLGAALSKACQSLGIDYVEETPSRPVEVRFQTGSENLLLPLERYYGRRLVAVDFSSLTWRDVTCPCRFCWIRRHYWHVFSRNLMLFLLRALTCFLWPFLLVAAAKYLWDRLADVLLVRNYWDARVWPFSCVNWFKGRAAFRPAADCSARQPRFYVLHLERRLSEEWGFWQPLSLY